MKREKSGTIIIVIAIIAVLGIAALLIIPKYNNLVTGEEKTVAAWAQVDNQLQRRFVRHFHSGSVFFELEIS